MLTDNGGLFPTGLVEPNDYHVFSYYVTISGQAADESLGFISTDLAMTGGWTPIVYDSSGVANPHWNPAGLPPDRTLYAHLQDFGVSGDFIDIQAVTDGNGEWKAAHHFNPGEAPTDGDDLGTPLFLGDLYLYLDLTIGFHILSLQSNAAPGHFQMWQGGNDSTDTPVGVLSGTAYDANTVPDVFLVAIVPEPATFALFALGLPALALIALRRKRVV